MALARALAPGLLAVMFIAAPAWAQNKADVFPNRPIRFVVPFAPGGSLDTLARIVGTRLYDSLGQPVVVDNRPAGGGTVGAEMVSKAQPDGYTLLIGSLSNIALAPGIYPKLGYDPLHDLTHVGMWVTFPLVMIVPAASPITNVSSFIEAARAKPGAMRFSAQGLGSSSHIFAEWMNSLAKIKVIIVPYKGGGPAFTGLLAGEVDYTMVAVSTAISAVQSGRVRALGVTSAKPTQFLPGVPAIASVLPGYNALNFHGLHAPPRMAPALTARLNAETNKILQIPAVAEKLHGFAMDLYNESPDYYRNFIKVQLEQWAPVIKSSGARAE